MVNTIGAIAVLGGLAGAGFVAYKKMNEQPIEDPVEQDPHVSTTQATQANMSAMSNVAVNDVDERSEAQQDFDRRVASTPIPTFGEAGTVSHVSKFDRRPKPEKVVRKVTQVKPAIQREVREQPTRSFTTSRVKSRAKTSPASTPKVMSFKQKNPVVSRSLRSVPKSNTISRSAPRKIIRATPRTVAYKPRTFSGRDPRSSPALAPRREFSFSR